MIAKKIKVFLVDDQKLVRQGLISIFKTEEDIDVIGEASNGLDLLRQLDEKSLVPDVILLDLEMPEMDGNQTIKALKENHPELKIVMLSMFSADYLINDFKLKGANAYLTKNVDSSVLVDTIKKVYFIPGYSNAERLRSDYTEREAAMIPLIHGGKTSKEISELLSVSIKTVEADRGKLYEKTGAANLQEFINYCNRNGLQFLGDGVRVNKG